MHWKKISLIGMGLLGGSLGLAIQQRRLADRVEGFVRRAASIDEAEKLKVVHRATSDLETAVAGAELIIFCTPLQQMRAIAERMMFSISCGAVVTDVGSVKSSVIQELEPLISAHNAYFVGSHPMAGAEKMGVSAARADLFTDAVCAITPTPHSDAQAVEQVEQFWRGVGAKPLKLSPELHDELVARCSHLPHVVAAEIANYVLSPIHPKEQATLCANGFKDTTRIASGSTEMWRDIALANRKHLCRVLGVFIEDLEEFCHALEQEDAKAIEEFFSQAKQRRDNWCAQSASPSPE